MCRCCIGTPRPRSNTFQYELTIQLLSTTQNVSVRFGLWRLGLEIETSEMTEREPLSPGHFLNMISTRVRVAGLAIRTCYVTISLAVSSRSNHSATALVDPCCLAKPSFSSSPPPLILPYCDFPAQFAVSLASEMSVCGCPLLGRRPETTAPVMADKATGFRVFCPAVCSAVLKY